ncbi:unnamed protein product, partial [marine sediment metagenome]
LILGAVGLFFVSTLIPLLPNYEQSLTATDAEGVHLVAQMRPLPRIPETFFVTHSSDAVTFSEPSTRSGRPAGVALHDEWLHCLLSDGSLVKLSGDKWEPIPAQLDWPILGIAVVADKLMGFGQSKDHARILTATLDNDTWRTGTPIDHEGDNIPFFQGVHSAGNDYVVWMEFRLEAENVAHRVHIGSITDGRLKHLPSLSFEGPIGMTAVGDETGVHVFFQEISIGPGQRR